MRRLPEIDASVLQSTYRWCAIYLWRRIISELTLFHTSPLMCKGVRTYRCGSTDFTVERYMRGLLAMVPALRSCSRSDLFFCTSS